MLEMYKGLVNSPETTITNNINESDTIIYVLDPARVPEPPNLMTLGTGTNAETVKVLEMNDNAITVERGFQGVAKSWPAGTVIARNFTEYDYGALKENIEDLDASKETPAGAQAKANQAEENAKNYSDQQVSAHASRADNPHNVTKQQVDLGNVDNVKQASKAELDAHLAEKVHQKEIHGLRATSGKLEYYTGTEWKTVSGGLPVGNVINFTATAEDAKVTLKWQDPSDVTIEDSEGNIITIARWKGTKILRKTGSYPVNENDGVLVVDNGIRDQYSTNGFVDTGLTNDVTYYYMAFPYTTEDVYTVDSANRVSATPQSYKIYGVAIDLNNSNPETAVTYTDDAVGMTGGDAAWDSTEIFKDIKPCVLKNGVVQYYLDPNDFTKKEDGTNADITSGNDGDVMIEIPKTGFLISTVGNILTVKVTDDPNNPNFKYYAHSRATEGDRSKLYIGAYLGWNNGGKLRSLSGKTPTADQTIGTFRTQAKANGSGYDLVSFYPLTLLQCLYLIKYKNLDSQTALGRGYVDGNSAATNTGGTNQKGMFFGETTGKQQMKFLGIEDFWGNLRWWIDGLFSDENYHILTAFKDFNNTGEGYVDNGQGATASISEYMSKVQGTSDTGFITKEANGSETTYFCDYTYLYASRLPNFGGHWNIGSYAGAFYLLVYYSASYSSSFLGGRLMYL